MALDPVSTWRLDCPPANRTYVLSLPLCTQWTTCTVDVTIAALQSVPGRPSSTTGTHLEQEAPEMAWGRNSDLKSRPSWGGEVRGAYAGGQHLLPLMVMSFVWKLHKFLNTVVTLPWGRISYPELHKHTLLPSCKPFMLPQLNEMLRPSR